MAQNLTGTFAATGQSASFLPDGVDDKTDRVFNVSLWGTFVATVQLERSLDGTNWLPLTANGTPIEKFTAPCSEEIEEDEATAIYRLNCTAYTSGTVNYRMSE